MSWLCGDLVNCEQNISFSNLVGDYIKGEGTYNGNLQYIIDSGTKYTFHEIKKQVEKLAKKLVNYKKITIIFKFLRVKSFIQLKTLKRRKRMWNIIFV